MYKTSQARKLPPERKILIIVIHLNARDGKVVTYWFRTHIAS